MTIAIIFLFLAFVVAISVPYWEIFQISDKYSFFSLVVATFTLIATVGIAVLIHLAQQNNEKRKSLENVKRAKAMMAGELEIALDELVLSPLRYQFAGRNTRTVLNNYYNELQDVLTADQFKHLNLLVSYIDYFSEAISRGEEESLNYDGMRLILREWLLFPMLSEYNCYYPFVKDFRDVLNKETFELLAVLKDSNEKYEEGKYEIRYDDGNIMYQYDPGKEKYRVFRDHEMILEGQFGYDEEFNVVFKDGFLWTKEFKGYYKDGCYDGQGVLFGKDGQKKEEGFFKNGNLLEGKRYNIVNFNTTEIIRPLEDYNGDNIKLLRDYIFSKGLDSIYVSDETVYNGKIIRLDNHRKLSDCKMLLDPVASGLIEKYNQEYLVACNS